MGAGAAGAVLGGAQLIGGFIAQRNQANAQRKQIAAQIQSAKDQAILRKMEIEQAQQYAKYQGMLGQLARQQANLQQQSALEAQSLTDQLSAQQLKFATEQQYIQSLIQSEQKQNQAGQLAVNAEGSLTQALEDVAGALTQGSSQSVSQNKAALEGMNQGSKRRALMDAMLAASGASGQGSLTSESLKQDDATNELKQVSELIDATNQDWGMLLERAGGKEALAKILRNLGINEASQLSNEAERQKVYSALAKQFGLSNIDSTLNMNSSARDAYRKAMDAARMMDENTQAANELFAQMGYNIQTNATDSAYNATLKGLRAQSSAIRSPGLLSLLTTGLGVYNATRPLYDNSLKNQQRQMELNAGLLSGIPTEPSYYSEPKTIADLYQ